MNGYIKGALIGIAMTLAYCTSVVVVLVIVAGVGVWTFFAAFATIVIIGTAIEYGSNE